MRLMTFNIIYKYTFIQQILKLKIKEPSLPIRRLQDLMYNHKLDLKKY